MNTTTTTNRTAKVINWCKKQRDLLVQQRKEANDPNLPPDSSVEFICEELRKMLESNVQNLLDDIEKRENMPENMVLANPVISASTISQNTIPEPQKDDEIDENEEEIEEEQLILGTSAIALATNVVVIRKKAIKKDSTLSTLYENLVEMIQEQMSMNHNTSEREQVKRKMQKITIFASTNKTSVSMLKAVTALVKIGLHCLSYLCKRIIEKTSGFKIMALSPIVSRQLKMNISWKKVARDKLEQYRIQLKSLEFINFVLEPMFLEIQDRLDSVHSTMFEFFNEKCISFLKKYEMDVNSDCVIAFLIENSRWKQQSEMINVIKRFLLIWETKLRPFKDLDQSSTCAYPLTIVQVLNCMSKIERSWRDGMYL